MTANARRGRMLTGNTKHTGTTQTTDGTEHIGSISSDLMSPRDDDPRVSVSYRMRQSTAQAIREFVRNNRGAPLFLELGSFIEQAAIEHMERVQRQLDEQSERRPSIALGRQRIVTGINNRRT